MSGCQFHYTCTVRALILSAIVGVLTALLQITGLLTLTTPFLWVTFGIAVAYLLVLTGAEVIAAGRHCSLRCCSVRNTVAAGILGTALLSLVLLGLELVSTSLVSGLLGGGLLFFFALLLTGTVCYAQCQSGCGSEG